MLNKTNFMDICTQWRNDLPAGIEATQVLLVLMVAAELGLIRMLSKGPVSLEVIKSMWGHQGLNLCQVMCELELAENLESICCIKLKDEMSELLSQNIIEFESYLRHKRRVYSSLLGLARILEGKSHPTLITSESDTNDYARAMHFLALKRKLDLSRFIDLSVFHAILDAGCGSGYYAQCILKTFPTVTATLVDFPSVLSIARQYTEITPVADRATFLPIDLLIESPPRGHDLALLFSVLHQYGPEDNIRILENIRQALLPSGTLMICDYISSNAEQSCQKAAFSLLMTAVTQKGTVYTDSIIFNILIKAGYANIQLEATGIDGLSILICNPANR